MTPFLSQMWDKVDHYTGIELRHLPPSTPNNNNDNPLATNVNVDDAGVVGPDDATVAARGTQLQFEALPTPPTRDDDPSRQVTPTISLTRL